MAVTSSFVVLGILYNELKTNIATLMAQEGVIVQITQFNFKKYLKKCNQVFFKCIISVKARDRKMDIFKYTPIYFRL